MLEHRYILELDDYNQRHMRGEKIMPSTQNAVNNHEYRSVPVTALAESATNPRKRFDAPIPAKCNAAISPGGRFLLTVHSDNGSESLWLRNIPTGSDMQVLPAPGQSFASLVFSPDGNSFYFRETAGLTNY